MSPSCRQHSRKVLICIDKKLMYGGWQSYTGAQGRTPISENWRLIFQNCQQIVVTAMVHFARSEWKFRVLVYLMAQYNQKPRRLLAGARLELLYLIWALRMSRAGQWFSYLSRIGKRFAVYVKIYQPTKCAIEWDEHHQLAKGWYTFRGLILIANCHIENLIGLCLDKYLKILVRPNSCIKKDITETFLKLSPHPFNTLVSV